MVTPKVTRANTDSEMILSWLNNKQSIYTQKHYAYSIKHFLEFVGKDLSEVKVEDIQDFLRSLQLRNRQRSRCG